MHIADIHGDESREPLAVVRWLTIHRAALFHSLGLPPTSWCGLFLKCSALFREQSGGDIDFIAGPLETSSDQSGDARVAWPPPVDGLVACEVKVSRYLWGAPDVLRAAEDKEAEG